MPHTLIIAEKPDAARRIAESLADNSPRSLKKNTVTYYEFTIDGKKHICVPAVGHLFVLNPKKDKDSKFIFEFEWVPTYTKKGTEWTRKYFENIKSLAKNATEFIDAADVDNEGEVLLYNILRFICGVEDAKRMKFSTLTRDELIESYKNIDDRIMHPLAKMGLTRHYLDALWGLNLSRGLMSALKSANKGFTILSIGRVQGPALELLRERELEIRNFKPTPFWELELNINIDGSNFVANYEGGRITDEKHATDIFNECKDKDATVEDIQEKQYKQFPYTPFNTTMLQSEAYQLFKFSPTQTLGIAESLYQAGYISYPRSSSEKLPPGIGYEKILNSLGKFSAYKKFVGNLLKKPLKPVEGQRTDPAHPAVYATHEIPDLSKLNAQQRKLYDLIARRTLAAFGQPATRETKTVLLDVNGHKFILTGKSIVDPGWMEIYAPYLRTDELILPEIKIGEKLKVSKIEMLSKETQPPGRYTQGSIVRELENRNLGTKATRAEILQTLYDRGYINGKSIEVTKLGEAVVNALEKNCPKIISEDLTRHFEEEMDKVYNDDKKMEEVVGDAKTILLDILTDFKRKEKEIGEQLAEGFLEYRKNMGKLGPCPRCNNDLKILRSKKGSFFVGCGGYPNCNNMYPLPRNAKIVAFNKLCPECKTPMVQVIRRNRRAFRMCLDPNCPTKADWEKK